MTKRRSKPQRCQNGVSGYASNLCTAALQLRSHKGGGQKTLQKLCFRRYSPLPTKPRVSNQKCPLNRDAPKSNNGTEIAAKLSFFFFFGQNQGCRSLIWGDFWTEKPRAPPGWLLFGPSFWGKIWRNASLYLKLVGIHLYTYIDMLIYIYIYVIICIYTHPLSLTLPQTALMSLTILLERCCAHKLLSLIFAWVCGSDFCKTSRCGCYFLMSPHDCADSCHM